MNPTTTDSGIVDIREKLKTMLQERALIIMPNHPLVKRIRGLAIHCHHNILLEYCYDFEKRVAAIKDTKDSSEQPVRLKLFKMLSKEAINMLPKTLIKACDKHKKAYDEYDKVYNEYEKVYAECGNGFDEWLKVDAKWKKANAKWKKANAKHKKANDKWDNKEEWHKKWCGCSEWNGEEIVFPMINDE